MKTPLAWRMITARPLATVLKLAAITFAIVLIFMQLALYELCVISAVQQYAMLDFDLVLTSSGYVDMVQPGSVARAHLLETLSDPDVVGAEPFYISTVNWRNPETGLRYPLLLMGAPPSAPVFLKSEVRDQSWLLTRSNGVLFDSRTMPLYGPRYVGLTTAAGSEIVTVMGLYSNGAGFAGGGAMIVSDATFFRLAGTYESGHFNLGLVKLKPGAQATAVAQRLQAHVPENVRVWSRAQIEASEQTFWISKKPLGIMFSSGVVIGFFIGAVIFYQVLATDILKHLREYATMKAIGYTDGAIAYVVLQQATLYALFSFAPALIIAIGLYGAMREGAAINIYMTFAKAALVFLMTLFMCAACALLGIRKTRTADPVELF